MRYKLQDGFKAEKVADEVVITTPSGDYVVLNETAEAVLNAIPNTCDNYEHSISRMLQAKYGLSAERADRDARIALGALRRLQIIAPESSPASSNRQIANMTRRTFATGMLATGISLLSPSLALGEESVICANKSFLGDNLISVEDRDTYRLIEDSLGRTVKIKKNIMKVVPYGPMAQSMMESIDPLMIVQAAARGLHASVASDSKRISDEIVLQTGRESSLSEYILESELPDLIIDIAVNKEMVCTEIEVQAENANVPVVHMIIGYGDLAQGYRTLGKILCREERCAELADYIASIEVTLAQVRERACEMPEKRVYLGFGNTGFTTCGTKSLVGQCLREIGAINIGDELVALGHEGISCLGEIANLKPDVVILSPNDNVDYLADIWHETGFDNDVRVSISPDYPDAWVGNSPLLTQTVGSLWMTTCIYPDLWNKDTSEVFNEFFNFMFGIDCRYDAKRDAFLAPSSSALAEHRDSAPSYISPSISVISAEELVLTSSEMGSPISPPPSGETYTSPATQSALSSFAFSQYTQLRKSYMNVVLVSPPQVMPTGNVSYLISVDAGCKSYNNFDNPVYDLSSGVISALLVSPSSTTVFNHTVESIPSTCASIPSSGSTTLFGEFLEAVVLTSFETIVSQLNSVGSALVFASDILSSLSRADADALGNYCSSSYQQRCYLLDNPATAQMLQMANFFILADPNDTVRFDVTYYVPGMPAQLDTTITKRYRIRNGVLEMQT